MAVYNEYRDCRFKRMPAIIMGILLSAIVLFSAFYIAAEAEHDCSGEDCPICVCIQQCERTLQQIAAGITELAATLIPAILLAITVPLTVWVSVQGTLVSRKVRLND